MVCDGQSDKFSQNENSLDLVSILFYDTLYAVSERCLVDLIQLYNILQTNALQNQSYKGQLQRLKTKSINEYKSVNN